MGGRADHTPTFRNDGVFGILEKKIWNIEIDFVQKQRGSLLLHIYEARLL